MSDVDIPVENALRELKSSVLPIPERYPVETILIEPKRRKSQPLLTFIHGGPHVNIATAFSPAIAAYALHGCTYHFDLKRRRLDLIYSHPECAQLYRIDRVWRFLCASVGRAMWYSRRRRCEGLRGSLGKRGQRGARPGEAVRHRGQPRRFPHSPP